MDIMSNMANMIGMNWSQSGAWGGAQQSGAHDSSRSGGGGPMRGSSSRESVAPYYPRR